MNTNPDNIENGPPTLSQQDHTAIVQLNRPKYHNRLDSQDLQVLCELFDRIELEHDSRVLILTATGKSFSSGYDLGDLKDKPEPVEKAASSEPTLFSKTVDQLENLRVPTICAFNGSVYGGSTDLALACDFRIGVHGMRFRMPAAKLGLQYYAGGLRRYVERLGLASAKKLFLTGDTIDSDELLNIGYLDEVVAADQIMFRAQQLADTLANNAPLAVTGMKRNLNLIARGKADDNEMNLAHAQSVLSEDAKEGVAAWHEKRTPQFRGR